MEETEKLTQHYRWQFLRLNKHYQRDYELYAKSVKAIYDSNRIPEGRKQEYIEDLETKLYIRYGINCIYNYKIKNPPSKLGIYGEADFAVQKGTLKQIFGTKLKDNQEISGNHLLETVRRQRKLKKCKGKSLVRNVPLITPRFVQVVINYNSELGDIHREIEQLIIPNQKLRQKELGIKRPKTRSESRAEDYDRYLQVWELRSKGIKNKKVAKEIFPHQDSRAAEDKASKYYDQALTLINGGYRKISF
jgi:hypothetical protein